MSYYLVGGEAQQLCTVVRTGRVADLQSMLDTGVDIDTADHNGETALHTAVYIEDDEMVKELLDRGANPDVQNKNGQTPLHLAAMNGYFTLVEMLVDAGADKTLITEFSEMTALHLATKNDHKTTVTYLLENGADPRALDMIKKPPKYYATNKEIKEQIEIYEDKTDDHQEDSSEGDWTSGDENDPSSSVRRRRSKKNRTQGGSSEGDWSSGDENDPSSSTRKRRSKKDRTHKNYLQDHKMEFSEQHKRKMKISVFDRLTRSKSKLDRLVNTKAGKP